MSIGPLTISQCFPPGRVAREIGRTSPFEHLTRSWQSPDLARFNITISGEGIMAGTWKPMVNKPTFNVDTMLLLTDGSLLSHETSSKNWHRLIPDSIGHYETGTWSAIAPFLDDPIIPTAKGG